jgi:serine/threonine protein phosphatase 1
MPDLNFDSPESTAFRASQLGVGGMRSYAIGDIHGHLDQLKRVHAYIAADRLTCGDMDAPIVHIGDLVDRGPDSRGVVDYLSAGIAAGESWVVLKGNHDRLFTYFMENPTRQDPILRADLSWLHPGMGGSTTLGSYGVPNASDRPIHKVHGDALHLVPSAHTQFLSALPTHFQRGEVFFAHAGIRPGIALHDQAEDDLLWIREVFLMEKGSHGPLVVHGHTALHAATNYGNRLNVDSGAAYGRALTAVVIEGRDVFKLGENGRQRLLASPDAAFR